MSLFIDACSQRPTPRTPIWMMRQAGRYMADYRALRARYSMLDCINTPELAAEITLQPIEAFGFDAAIIFSDILPPLQGMGLHLDFVKGKGPVIANPVRSAADIDRLTIKPAAETMAGTLAAVTLVANALHSRDIPLIGFCGAPFTLATYAIEGGSSKNHDKTKVLMMSHPAVWHQLMEKLVTVQADYLIAQAASGAAALQIFDSWAGILSRADYIEFVQPHTRALIDHVQAHVDLPIINFSTGTSAYLDAVAAAGGDVIGVDWRMPISQAWAQIDGRAIQGNLDPIALLGSWDALQYRIDRVLAQVDGRPGHIFNLGHGILPHTPIENVQRTIAYVREKSSQSSVSLS